ncbi:MAG TPA: tRNA (adenosine(37)-N6)-threonylcarbamoyltransferase complex dimerization subunit type 1 TsaB [Gemmatimonadales bacterium]
MSASPFALRPSALLLSIDSATDRPTLAIGAPGRSIDERVIPQRHDLSRDIDSAARALLEAHGGSESLGGVLVADGPGSFTGLRIGIAFAKGVVGALRIPLFAAPSMMGAALGVAHGPTVVEYDALRGDVYRAVYHFTADAVRTIQAPQVVPSSPPADPGFARAFADRASAAALLGLMGLPGGVEPVEHPGAWQPSYGRLAEAEARRLARHAGA